MRALLSLGLVIALAAGAGSLASSTNVMSAIDGLSAAVSGSGSGSGCPSTAMSCPLSSPSPCTAGLPTSFAARAGCPESAEVAQVAAAAEEPACCSMEEAAGDLACAEGAVCPFEKASLAATEGAACTEGAVCPFEKAAVTTAEVAVAESDAPARPDCDLRP